MNNQTKYYRVVNECCKFDTTYDSVKQPSSRQQKIRDLYPQIEAICILSLQCDIKLSSALKIATYYRQVLEKLKEAEKNGDTTVPMKLFGVSDESKTDISFQHIRAFILTYNRIYEETRFYLDGEKFDGQYIWEGVWEFVRRKKFPNKNSRLESVFAFDKIEDANIFLREYRRGIADIAQVETSNAIIERYDMQWVTDVPVSSTMKEAMEYAVKYWEEEQTPEPIFEMLIKGKYQLRSLYDYSSTFHP